MNASAPHEQIFVRQPPMLANIITFQAGWFICVLGAANGWNWLGVIAALVVVVRHLYTAVDPLAECKLIMAAVATGFVWDSLLALQGWLTFPNGSVIEGFAPSWILALWLMFATTLNVSLRWLRPKLWTAMLLGAVFGPLSYWGAMRLGAVEFVRPTAALLMLAAGWALIMPLLMLLASRFDGAARPARMSQR